MAASRRHTLHAKFILLCALAGVVSFYIEKDAKGRLEEGEHLTIEQYTADFEVHKAELSKPVRPTYIYMVGSCVALCVAFSIYEILGTLLGRLFHKVGLLPDRPPDQDDDETRALKAEYPGTDLSVPFSRVQLIGGPLTVATVVAILIPFWYVWGWQSVRDGFEGFFLTPVFIVVLLLSIVLHEGLHAVGFVWLGRVNWRQIKFGVKWKALAAYAHAGTPVRASIYRTAIALPGLMLGIVPSAAAITTGNGWLLYYGLLMTISAVGDLFILLAVRSLEPNRLVFDHPKRIGCWVLDETPEESAKSTSPTL